MRHRPPDDFGQLMAAVVAGAKIGNDQPLAQYSCDRAELLIRRAFEYDSHGVLLLLGFRNKLRLHMFIGRDCSETQTWPAARPVLEKTALRAGVFLAKPGIPLYDCGSLMNGGNFWPVFQDKFFPGGWRAIILFGLLIYGLGDLLKLSLVRAWAISSVCFAESIRKRVLLITPLAILGIILVSQLQHPIDGSGCDPADH